MNDSDLIFGLMAAFGKNEYAFSDLVHLSLPFKVTETSLRTNLSRMSKRDLILTRREGKNGFYSFAEKGNRIKENVSKSFNSLDWNNWDNMWWGIFFSVPEVKKAERYKIRKKLLSYRFVSLYPGFWIRPMNKLEKLEKSLSNIFNNEHCKVIKFQGHKEFSRKEVSKLWNLDEINNKFKKGLELLNEKMSLLTTMAPIEALKERMITGGLIVDILFKDPLLPDMFLPNDWKADELKKKFEIWDKITTEKSRSYWEKIFK